MLGRKRRTGTNKNYVCLWLVLPQCDFCVPAWRFCTTWMASCKGPITEFYVKQQLCTCSTFFCTFLCRHCTTTTWNYQALKKSSTFWVNVNERWRNFSLSLAFNLDMVPRNSTPEEFACIRQRRWVGIIAIEVEKLRVSPCKRYFPRRRRRGILNSLLHDMEGLKKSSRLVL